MNLIIKAAKFASDRHAGQQRKWIGTPYIEHPMRVAGRVTLLVSEDASCMLQHYTECLVAAAWLHDVMEDCGVSFDELAGEFNLNVATIVSDLTNSKRTGMKRADRKREDRDRLAVASPWVKRLKLVDRLDNIREIDRAPDDFKYLYRTETLALVDALHDRSDPFNMHLVREIETLLRR